MLRLRMPDEDIVVHDMIRGEIVFRAGSIPDYVVVRANGQPLYTLTNPVDDALMEITHVLRGEDLLSSTPRQIALFRVLVEIGFAKYVPEYGHLPYVMGQGNKKLSKRDPEAHMELYREQGFLPEGLLNYLALLGWSIAPDRDVFTLEEMVQAFDIKDVNPNPARFDLKKAEAINTSQLRLLPLDDDQPFGRPVDIGRARLLHGEGLYAARIVRTPQGPALLGFEDAGADGSFVGRIPDPVPVRWDAAGLLVATPVGSAS